MLERHDRIGTETSSRNSEVIHAGLYYPPGSLRAKLCVAGKALLYASARRTASPTSAAASCWSRRRPSEIAKLEAIAANAAQERRRRSAAPVGRGGARARAGARLRRRLSVAVDRRHRQPRPDAGARRPPDDARRPGRAQRSRDRASARRCGRTASRIEIAERRRDAARSPRATSCSPPGFGATALGRMLAYPAGYRVPETYPAQAATTSRSPAARRSATSSIPCRRAPGSACT